MIRMLMRYQAKEMKILNINNVGSNDPSMPSLEETGIFDDVYDDREVGAEANTNNLELSTVVSPIPTTRVHKDHPKEHIIKDLNLATQIRRMINFSKENAMVSYINKQRRTNHKYYQNCLFACFLSQQEPKKVIQALADPSWIEAMKEDLLQFKLQKIWNLMDLLNGKRAIGTKWVFRNKKDERGIVVRNKARLVAQEEEVYVCQPPGFEDPHFPNKVYKVEKALYGLHQAPRAWYETLSTYLLENRFRRGTIGKTLFIKKDKGDIILVQVYVDDIIFGSTKKSLCDEFERTKDDGIFIGQDKYVADILKKFDFTTVKTASTLMEPNKALIKDVEAKDVDVHLYRLMIRSLMYLIASRLDIMFVVCTCARFHVTPKTSHLHVVKRIFRYLKGQPKLGLWYPKDSPFDLEAFSDSNYARASLDKKSTIGSCQFLGKRLISWKYKKQTIVANSTTKAEYVVTANYCRHVLWIQNQMLYYGFNFMNTKIYIDNESTICIVKNPVFYSKTKHIEIRHHFIRDSYEKKLIQVIKIHTDHNVLDLLTEAFDVIRFNFLIAEFKLVVEQRIVLNGCLDWIATVAKNEIQVSAISLTYYCEMITTVQTLIEIKAAKPMARGVIVQEPSEFRTTSSLQPSQLSHAKDKEVARNLEAQMKAKIEEEERIAREKNEANIVVIEEWMMFKLPLMLISS
nr:hypothetical protein [Tanacetum cinerariifolium]